MSLHPSLRIGGGEGTAHRNVFKRQERVKILQKEGRWKPGDPVFGLAKVKHIKIKVKKEAKVAAAEGAAAPTAGGAAATTAAAPAKGAAPAKKGAEKSGGK